MADSAHIKHTPRGGHRLWEKHGRRLAAFFMCGLLSAGPLSAEPFVADTVMVIDVGVFCPDTVNSVSVEAPETELGYIHRSTGTVPVSFATTLVPAQLGFGFGMRLLARPGTPPKEVDVIITHPSGKTGETITERWQSSLDENNIGGSRFMFEFDFELALGDWVFEIREADDLLFREVFNVVPPQQLPHIVNGCSGDIPMS